MDLIVQKREKFGKQTGALRKQGFIPAELYGNGIANAHLAVSTKAFNKVFKQAGESTLINLVLESENNQRRPVMINDVRLDPVTDQVLNVDFYQVRLDQQIKVKIAINFIGEAPAVKSQGGVFVKAMQEIEVEALPASIPHSLEVGLANLIEIGKSIYVRDLRPPAGVKILVNPETVIATITAQVAEEEIATAPEITVDTVKVETEEKKAERVAKKEAAGQEGAKAETAPKNEKK